MGRRGDVLRALGESRQEWAVRMVVDVLATDEDAAPALSALGDAAVPIIERAASSGDSALVRRCLTVAEAVGSVAALAFLARHLWSASPDVRQAAAWALARSLDDGELRRAFDAGEVELAARADDEAERRSGAWMTPWLDEGGRRVRVHYVRVVAELAKSALGPSVEEGRRRLERIPVDVLAPVLIEAGEDAVEALGLGKERSPLRSVPGRRSGEQRASRLDAARSALRPRRATRNRVLWATARGKPKKDIGLGTWGSYAFFSAVTAAASAPLVAGVMTSGLSPWALLAGALPGLLIGFGIYYGVKDRAVETAAVGPGLPGLSPAIVATLLRQLALGERVDDAFWPAVLVSGASFAPLLAGSLTALGGLSWPWFLCLVPVLAMPAFYVEVSPDRLILLRRANPLLDLRLRQL